MRNFLALAFLRDVCVPDSLKMGISATHFGLLAIPR
jgi:hypothetical protein